MLKNVTLTAEQSLIERARAKADRHGTALNQAFREWIARYVEDEDPVARYRKLMGELRHVRAGRKFTREEMNELR